MRRLWLAAGLLGLVLLLLAGCSKTRAVTDWNVTVAVTDRNAVITVAVPGLKLGKDYHPHIRLDDGAELMMFTATYTFEDLAPGPHQVRVYLADAGHRPMPDVERILPFAVP